MTETIGKATLIGLHRGFGNDSYDFELYPPMQIKPGVAVNKVTLVCGWGLLSPMHIYILRETHTNVEILKGVDENSPKWMARPIEVLRNHGYEVTNSIDGDFHLVTP